MISSITQRAFRLTAAAPVAGSICEFGVFQGGGLAELVNLASKYHLEPWPRFFGFDTFAGIPESSVPLADTLATNFGAGQFANTSLQAVQRRVPDAELIAAEFSELSPLAAYGIETIRLVHFDGDIYEGYRDPLRLITPHLQVGTVVICDESVPPNDWSRQSIREHGQRALREWESDSGLNLHLIRFEWTVGLYVIADKDYLREHWWLIDDLRKDTPRESLELIARRALGRPLESRPSRGELRRTPQWTKRFRP